MAVVLIGPPFFLDGPLAAGHAVERKSSLSPFQLRSLYRSTASVSPTAHCRRGARTTVPPCGMGRPLRIDDHGWFTFPRWAIKGARKLGLGEIIENGTIGPFVVAAGYCELAQGIRHRAEFNDFRLELFDMRERDGSHLRACPGPIVP